MVAALLAGVVLEGRLVLVDGCRLGRLTLVLGDPGRAQARLVAMSEALISTLERFWPSGVSQERCSSRPVTVTRVPRARDSVAFSASSAQATTSKKLVDSSQVSSSRLSQRRLTAMLKLVVACPEGVKRSSGPWSGSR